jgi:hypothetical protein
VNPCHPDATPDGSRTPAVEPIPEHEPAEPTLGLELTRLPRAAIDWDRTHLTPAFVRALARAQGEAATVGKDSKIEATAKSKARPYAGADAMIAEATRVLAPNGIAWVCASTSRATVERRHLAEYDDGNTQWVCSVIETESVLMHAGTADDPTDEIGLLVTTGEAPSIGRRGTPIDKADKAAETYLRLYLARDLLGLDRGDATDDPNARDDSDEGRGPVREGRGPARNGGVSTEQALTAARRKVEARWKPLAALLKARDGSAPDPGAFAHELLGHDAETLEDLQQLDEAIGRAIEEVKTTR